MTPTHNRFEDTLKINKIIRILQKYSYLETLFLVSVFLIIGYTVSPEDICLTQQSVPYLLILLSIITLFHGFESGMLALGIIATTMWWFYEYFPYTPFLINLLMVMIFSEFHYYWTKQIKELRTSNDYKTIKLNELVNAFYSLKISHDQLEKNYVLKPMSIRSAIEEILYTKEKKATTQKEYFIDFLALLEKSFHMQGGFVIYADNQSNNEYLNEENSHICFSITSEEYPKEEIFKEYVVAKAINYKQAVYISDDEGSPALRKDLEESKFLAAIPVIYDNRILALLVIEKMPFMAFNRENLISLSILFEYLLITVLKQELLHKKEQLLAIKDKNFRYEYIRTFMLYQKYKTNSTIMVLKITSEIQSVKIYEKSKKMLRALDLVTYHIHKRENEYLHFIIYLFPLNDKSAAIGFLNRLITNLDDNRDKTFEHMIFDVHQERLIQKYIEDDYHD